MKENTCFFGERMTARPLRWVKAIVLCWETAGGCHGATFKKAAGVRAAEFSVVEAQLGTGRAIGCCRECAEAWRSQDALVTEGIKLV